MKSDVIQSIHCPASPTGFSKHEAGGHWIHSEISQKMLVSECRYCMATLYRDGYNLGRDSFSLTYVMYEEEDEPWL